MASKSINYKIAQASIIIGFFTIISKLASMGKEIIIAHSFGRGDALDAFLIAMVVPSFFINVISGSINAALIPTYIQSQEKLGKDAAQKLFSTIMTITILLLIFISFVLILTAPYYLPLIASGFSSIKLKLTLHLTYILMIILLISGMITIWNSVLNAGEKFALTAFSPIFVPLTSVLCIWVMSGRLGISALAIGTVIGMIFNAIILVLGLKRQGIHLKFGWQLSTEVRKVMSQYAPMVAGAIIMSSTILVDKAMAAMLPSGSVSALEYGYKVIAFFTGIVIMALSTSVLPYFSKQVAVNDKEGLQHTFNTFFIISLWISVPVMSFIFIFSKPIVQILFQRGAFTAEDTQVVAKVQLFYSFMLPSYIVGILGVRLISSKLGNKILMYGAIINLITNIVLNIVFMKIYGVAGIALSTSVVYFISTSYILFFVIYKYKISLSYKTLIICLIFGITIYIVYFVKNLNLFWYYDLLIFVIIYTGLFILCLKILRWSILKYIKRMFNVN